MVDTSTLQGNKCEFMYFGIFIICIMSLNYMRHYSKRLYLLMYLSYFLQLFLFSTSNADLSHLETYNPWTLNLLWNFQ